ncbi:hypothetical protein V8E52_005237 [Russula decolorans]
MIANIRNAQLKDDIDDANVLYRLRNPLRDVPELDEQTQISLELFSALAAHPKSAYEEAHRVFNKTRPDSLLHSYWVVKSRLEKLSGITQIETDMCPNSCVAFTGPFAILQQCPECAEPRYDNKKPGNVPLKRFYMISLGPQIQAQWQTPEGANWMRYRNHKTTAIHAKLDRNPGKPIDIYEDIYDGYQYLEAVKTGHIKEDDTLVLFSLDGAQLYRDKNSDCYFFVWIILNLSPDFCYKKAYILPGGFVPGPNPPRKVESFLLPSFRHVSAVQRKGGLAIWDGQKQQVPDNCRHPDVDLETLTVGHPQQYLANLQHVLASPTKTTFEERQLTTGITRPTICLGFQPGSMYAPPLIFTVDLMHLNGNNLPLHLLNLWHGKVNIIGPRPAFQVLDNEAMWMKHACNLGEGYAFLPEKEDHHHIPLDGSLEDLAFHVYLEEIYPEWQPSKSFLVQHWARLQLPNGQ